MSKKKKSFNSMKARYGFDRMTNWGILEQKDYDSTSADKVNVRGTSLNSYADPLIRLREDKLRSLKRALYNSYQSAIIVFDKDDRQYHFRCLINHDKLKVDYEDKVLSIPFKEVPVEFEGNKEISISQKMVDTGTAGRFLDENGNPVLDQNGQVITQYRVKPGDTFKWISGNEGYMPDSYWIIFLQYSEQTAYFRGQIRKADDEIEVIPIGDDGEQGDPEIYHGWTTGPNEDQAIWNVKKGVVWNDMYYTKILYITKDETTQAFFRRFDRVVINGQTWEVQGYNDNYGTSSKNAEGGMIRVALKETYTSTNEVIKDMLDQEDIEEGEIFGPTSVQGLDVVKYYITAAPFIDNQDLQWTISAAAPIKILSKTKNQIKLEIKDIKTKTSFDINYGTVSQTITVKPFN